MSPTTRRSVIGGAQLQERANYVSDFVDGAVFAVQSTETFREHMQRNPTSTFSCLTADMA